VQSDAQMLKTLICK